MLTTNIQKSIRNSYQNLQDQLDKNSGGGPAGGGQHHQQQPPAPGIVPWTSLAQPVQGHCPEVAGPRFDHHARSTGPIGT